MSLHTYIPQDRLRTFSRNETLPDRTSGSALFADISGFTALTEGLRETLGSRRGGEELSKHLGVVYSALIAEVEKHGGSMVNFAGDAITCWFDDANGPAAPRSLGCAFAQQQAMKSFSAIALPRQNYRPDLESSRRQRTCAALHGRRPDGSLYRLHRRRHRGADFPRGTSRQQRRDACG